MIYCIAYCVWQAYDDRGMHSHKKRLRTERNCVMRYVKPDYYDDFRCIADKCPDTCCAGWQIVIDEKTLTQYEKEPGLVGKIDWQEGIFKQYGGRCAMLNDRNLCDLIIKKGEEWLCDTCNRYPRHIEEFDGVREMSLSLSCPVAAEMMLRREEPMCFFVEEDDETDPLEEEFEDFDFLLYTCLEDAREVLFGIVQDREMAMEKRMHLAMRFARDLQMCLDEERLYDMEDVIAAYKEKKETVDSAGKIAAMGDREVLQSDDMTVRYRFLKENFALFYELERLREEWTDVIEKAERTLYARGEAGYIAIYEAFDTEFIGNFGRKRWEIMLEQILMFFLYTYFCGAVYDDCIYSKVGMAVFSATYIQEFIMCDWYVTGKKTDMQECIRMTYRYAREVEHSDENLNKLEEWLLDRM